MNLKNNKNPNAEYKNLLLWILLAFILANLAGLSRIGVIKSNAEGSYYNILNFILIYIIVIIDLKLKKNYYTIKALNIIIKHGNILFTYKMITSPKNYFKKGKFLKGYIYYLFSRICIFILIYTLIKFIITLI